MSLYDVHPVAEIFPLMQNAEYAALLEDIKQHGVREPIWLHPDGRIIDGRNRHRAAYEAGVPLPTRQWDGSGSLVEFVLSLNLHRRHLSPSQLAVVAREVEPLLAQEAKERQRHGGQVSQQGSQIVDYPDRNDGKAAQQAAKLVGTNRQYVADVKRIAAEAPELLDTIFSGELTVPRASRILRDRQAESARIDKARKQDRAIEFGVNTRLLHGDFREVLADLTDVDAIITDPPYPHEFIPLLADLADLADRILTKDGVLAVLMGQSFLPDVYRLMEGRRKYRWTACYLTPGAGYASHARRVQSNWKPLIVYGGGPRFADVFHSKGVDADAKNNHEWGQDFQAFYDIVDRLTMPGQTVVDPFAGSGTTLLAAKSLGRHSIGAEIDTEHYEAARRRLGL